MADKKTTTTPAKTVSKKVVKQATEVKTLEQLREELQVSLVEQAQTKRSHAQGELVNPHILTTKRKAVARLHTAINAAVRAAKEIK